VKTKLPLRGSLCRNEKIKNGGSMPPFFIVESIAVMEIATQ